MSFSKVDRVLNIYDRLLRGIVVNKKQLSIEFEVDIRTIQRDIDDIRNYLIDSYESENILYDYKNNGYFLVSNKDKLISSIEIFSIIKILLESRAFCREEMEGIIKSIFSFIPKLEMNQVKPLILNEKFHFQPVTHDKPILSLIWDLGQCILKKEVIELYFNKANGEKGIRAIYPLAIVFSEFYFYLVAQIEGLEKKGPAFFRIDRIEKFITTDRRFYLDRFEEGELKKRILFMYGGDLIKIKFIYKGKSIEHIMDRFPISKVLSKENDTFKIEAEVYGKGCLMWFLSQGENIELISPKTLRAELIAKIDKMKRLYE